MHCVYLWMTGTEMNDKRQNCANTTPRPEDPSPWSWPLPVFCNGIMNRQHLSFGTRDILGWSSWIEGGELLKKPTVSRGYMTSAQLPTQTQRAVPASQ